MIHPPDLRRRLEAARGRTSERLSPAGLGSVTAIGPTVLIDGYKVALFCSAEAAGERLLGTLDAARFMRDSNLKIISGLHSPIAKECLEMLLRGKQSIIICPACATENMRIPKECRPAFDAGRILFLSPFKDSPHRVTRASAKRRHKFIAAMADATFLPHTTLGGDIERMAGRLTKWQVPIARTVGDLQAMEQCRPRQLEKDGDAPHV